MLDDKFTEELMDLYDEGFECGENKTGVIAQRYIFNPFLYNVFYFYIYILSNAKSSSVYISW